MIKLLDQNKQVLHLLLQVKDFYIESNLATADKLITFKIPRQLEACTDIIQERYLLTSTDEYTIKEVNYTDSDYLEVFGKLNLEDLKAKVINNYTSTERHLSMVLDDILIGTGWTYELNDVPNKLRTITKDNTNACEVITDVCKTYGVEVAYDTLTKTVRLYQALGADRGAYVYSDLNLKKTDFQSDTYDFKTRLYAYGKDGLTFSSINNGKEYIDNFQHSNKIVEMVWKDDRYTVAENLLADSIIKLSELSKPRLSFTIDVLNLVGLRPEYNILDFKLGDTVKIMDKQNEFMDSQRIVKLIEYPMTPEKNKIDLSNTKIVFVDNIEQVREVVTSEIIKTRTELMTAIDATSGLIKADNGGFIITRFNVDNQPYEQLIMNTDSVLTATKLWRWNINGLGYSSTGYNGTYKLAITANGEIVADFITTGTLNASLIKAGLLQSVNGTTWIDMTTGYFNFGNRIINDASGLRITVANGETVDTAIANAKAYAEGVALTAKNDAIAYSESQLSIYTNAVTADMLELQNQIDGSITTWFYTGIPTTSNVPENGWTTNELRNIHLGDIYYDDATGYSYRYTLKTSVYSWTRITDSDITTAILNASKAQDTADSKRRVFVIQPFPPYDLGDLWVQGNTGDLMRCTLAKISGVYVSSDWVKATKYTDDATAIANLTLAKTYANEQAVIASTEAKAHADTKALEAQTASEEYALAQATLAKTQASAYADGIVDAEEALRIAQALANLNTAKAYAVTVAEESELAAKTYAETKATEAQTASQLYALAEATLAQSNADAHSDGIVSAEETARIAQATANLATAKAYSETKSTEALTSAKTYSDTASTNAKIASDAYALAMSDAAKAHAEVYADGKVSVEEQARITDVNAKLATAKAYSEAQALEAENAAKYYADAVGATKENSWIKSATIPSLPVEGLIWIDTSVEPNIPKRYVGGEWIALVPTSASDIGAYTAVLGESTAGKVANIETTLKDGSIITNVINSQAMTDLLSGKTNATQVGTIVKQTTDGIDSRVVTAQNSANSANGKFELVETFMAFKETGLLLGKSNSPLQINISNTEMQFLNNNAKVAYINNQEMYITTAKITSTIKMGVHEIKKHDANTTIIRWVGDDN